MTHYIHTYIHTYWLGDWLEVQNLECYKTSLTETIQNTITTLKGT